MAFIVWTPHNVQAADSLFNFKSEGNSHPLFPKIEQAPKSKQGFANLYYKNCMATNENPELAETTALQCACTSSAMTEIMSLQNMKDIYDNTPEGRFQQTRLMVFAYIPCMKTPIETFVLDQCLYNPQLQKTLRYERRVCHCMAEGMGEKIVEKGKGIIPGFNRLRYDPRKSVPNPLEHVIMSEAFSIWEDYYLPTCIYDHEYQ